MKRVLIASDGSQHAENAARLLAHFPHNEKLEITVVSVVPNRLTDQQYAPEQWVQKFVDQQVDRANDTYATIESIFEGSNSEINHVIRRGHAGQNIVELSESLRTDLIVIGAKGHSAIDRILLGSTSDYVATEAKCSVLVVRPTGLEGSDRAIRIALAYDDKEPSRLAQRMLQSVPWGNQSELHVVTALTRVFGITGIIAPSDKSIAKAAETAERVAQELKPVSSNAQPHVIQDEQFGEGLVHFAENHHCDMIVVGETERTALGRAVFGSVSRYVLRHAPCCVWITR